MQYKMQFTVLDDAVKQNRKLPEIAFFDTDGNLIHLGGGDGGGDVDLTHLTSPIGFTDGPSLVWGDIDAWGSDYPVLSVQGMGGPDLYSELDVVGATLASVAEDGSTFSALTPYGHAYLVPVLGATGVIHVAVPGDTYGRFTLDADGAIHWGDGSDAPDTALYRSGGFGAGYGHLSADAGGGFEVMSSAPEAEGSFVQIAPDAGYGGYLWIHNLSGHTDKDALYFDVEGEANPRFKAKIDGEMLWGDGTTAPDVSLERAYPGALGVGEAVYLDGLSGQVGVYPASDLTQPIFAGGLNGGSDRYQVLADGSIHWGDGTGVPDVTLERDATGAYNASGTGDLRLSGIGEDHALILGSLDGDYTQAGGYVGGSGAYWQSDENHRVNIHNYGAIDLVTQDGVLELEGAGLNWAPVGGGIDTTLKRSAPGILRNTANGGGFKLTSPDGSQTKTVRLSNAGALELV